MPCNPARTEKDLQKVVKRSHRNKDKLLNEWKQRINKDMNWNNVHSNKKTLEYVSSKWMDRNTDRQTLPSALSIKNRLFLDYIPAITTDEFSFDENKKCIHRSQKKLLQFPVTWHPKIASTSQQLLISFT